MQIGKNIFFCGAVALTLSNFAFCQISKGGEDIADLRAKAEKGDPSAQNNLGWHYQHGVGVQKDLPAAVQLYEKAASKGDALGQCNYGTMLIYGWGCKQDQKQAKEQFEKAAAQKNRYGYYELGVVYEQGLGVKPDFSKAFEYYKKAALLGVPEAMNNLASMKAKGQLKGDWNPLEMYKESAAQGSPMAEFNIGMLYLEGEGVEQNDKLAVEWLEKAAKHGHVEAQCNLGVVLVHGGKGVPQNRKDAVHWLNKAAAAGDNLAKDALKRLNATND